MHKKMTKDNLYSSSVSNNSCETKSNTEEDSFTVFFDEEGDMTDIQSVPKKEDESIAPLFIGGF
jgi:hypothetical protein